MNPLPVLLSIPHSGQRTPPELAGRTALDLWSVLGESDVFTREIYDLEGRAARVVSAEIARVFVDLNRSPKEWPPGEADCVIKDITTYGEWVYRPGRAPDRALFEELVAKYYHPYHAKLREEIARPGLKLGLDCHAMAGHAPPTSARQGRKRPLVCLGDVYGQSAPEEMTVRLMKCFLEAFSLEERDVTINDPFSGGYITQAYGGSPVPWIQVELSKALYLDYPLSRRSVFEFREERLLELNEKFWRTLELFFEA